jgi:hypothetical protein
MRVAALLLLAACTDPAIDMTMSFPATNTSFDLSCVGAVDVLPIAVGDTKSLDIGYRESSTMDAAPCIDLATPPTSFADVEAQIRGKLDLPLPPGGLAAVEVRGRAGSCNEMPAYHEAVFYGAAQYNPGDDSLVIPISHNISCNQAASYTVRPVDLVQLVKTKTCAPIDSQTGQVFDADYRPTHLAGSFPPVVFEAGPEFKPLASGIATLDTYSGSYAGTCPTVAWEDITDSAASCINPGAATACANPGEVELPLIRNGYSFAPPEGARSYEGPVIGAVWSKSGTPGPLAGATVTFDEGADATVVYGNVGTDSFTPAAGATATDPSGMFMVFTNGVVGLTVTATGRDPVHLFVGSAHDMGGAAIAVLD